MKKNIFKFIFDIGMALLFILLYPVELTGLKFHEIAGLVLGVPLIIHLLLNWKWITSVTRKIFSKNTPGKTKVSYLLNLLLLLDMLIVIISGLLVSHILFPNLRHYGSGLPMLSIHISSASLGVILVGVHIGMHWNWMIQIGKQISIRLFKSKRSLVIKKPLYSFLKYSALGIGTILLAVTLSKAMILPVTLFSDNVDGKASGMRGGHEERQVTQSLGSGSQFDKEEGRHGSSSPVGTALGLTMSVASYVLLFGAAAYYTHIMENKWMKKRKIV